MTTHQLLRIFVFIYLLHFFYYTNVFEANKIWEKMEKGKI